MNEELVNNFFEKHSVLTSIRSSILEAANAMVTSYRQGGQLLVCGNGGSCSDSDHITGELLKGFLKRRPLPDIQQQAIYSVAPQLARKQVAERLQMGLPAISLCSHHAVLTAIANDLGADLIYAQQVMAYGRMGDIFIGISTSGNADNVWKALAVAKSKKMYTIGLTGGTGGKLSSLADCSILAPSSATPCVQEYHLAIYHFLCAYVEATFFKQ